MNLKSFLTALALVAAASNASAANDPCKKTSALAKQAMTARQNGQPLEDALEKVGDGSAAAKEIILKAYEEQVYPAGFIQTTTITDFQNDAFRQCLKASS